MNIPQNLKYTKDHEWAKIEGKTAIIGITDHAQSALGDIVFVELPKVGRVLKASETFGVVESVKAVSDLYSPVAGKVTEAHQDLVNQPNLLNQDPYDKGWLIKVELSDAAPSTLMDSKSYTEYVKSLA